MQLGYAFQITDDLLDICGSSIATGKPVLHDLAEGYITLPIIKLLADPCYGLQVRNIIESGDFGKDNMTFIQNALKITGILAEIQQKARNAVTLAIQYINELPEKPQQKLLIQIAEYIIHRDY